MELGHQNYGDCNFEWAVFQINIDELYNVHCTYVQLVLNLDSSTIQFEESTDNFGILK